MRKYTVVFSVVAHAVAASLLLLAPVLATTELPEPRRATEFVQVNAVIPVLPPPQPRLRPVAPPASPDAAPLDAPDGVSPEAPAALPGDDPAPVPGSGFVDLGEPIPFTPIAPPRQEPAPRAPLRAGGSISLPTRISNVTPIYPSIARSARVSGVVILEVVIGEDGAVRDAGCCVRSRCSIRPRSTRSDSGDTRRRCSTASPSRWS
jgi:periplasmic protein TonB